MAKTGTIQTSSYNSAYLVLEWNIKSQSIENNKSVIDWKLRTKGIQDGGYWETLRNAKVTINGVVRYAQNGEMQIYNNTVVATGTVTIPHDNSGSKSVNIAVEGGIYYNTVNIQGNGVAVLDTIPRASGIESLDVNNRTLGKTTTLRINRASDSFTHSIWYRLQNTQNWRLIGNGVGTTISFTLFDGYIDNLPNSTKGAIDFKVRTFKGSQKIGDDVYSRGYNVFVPDTLVPSLDFTVNQVNQDIQARFGACVQGKSKVKVNITANGVRGSTIKSHKIKMNGTVYNAKTATSDFLKNSGTNNIICEVVDSRGRKKTLIKSINVLSYESPKILKLSTNRINASGNYDATGTRAKTFFKVNILSMNNKNTKSVKLFYREKDSSSWISLYSNSDDYTVDTAAILAHASESKAYEFKLEVRDYFVTVERICTLATAFFVLSYATDGTKRMALGKVVEMSTESIDCGLPIYYNGKPVIYEIEKIGNRGEAGGEATKYSDGSMRVRKTLTVTPNFSTWSGLSYFTINFRPAVPFVNSNIAVSYSVQGWGLGLMPAIKPNNLIELLFWRPNSNVNGAITAYIECWGYWK
ncbi:MAG: DUF859 family phage minor structural protein [Tissierellia bacterium]|nr:DUF859 family phage minor structural protein [Tissierellia bacterium]